MRWIVVVVALAAIACGPKRKNQCPGNVAGTCAFNDQVCSFDRKRGCQVCQCRSLLSPTRDPEPDDPSAPPSPVH